ncbi:MAG: hypothetical protein GF334_06350, partial [Candidatus Altiarchaeales archaeon]|nr:hypothetical protein [Candidatus Altiarchaeales archaeon]
MATLAEIQALLAQGLNQKQVAAELGMSSAWVSMQLTKEKKRRGLSKGEKESLVKQLEALEERRAKLGADMESYEDANRIEFFDKEPNPGPNPKQAQILEAFLDPFYRVFGMSGGNRLGKCVISSTYVDTPDGKVQVGKLFERGKPFKVYAWDGEKKVVARASAPFKKAGLHRCYSVCMTDGEELGIADRHRILTEGGDFLPMTDVLGSFFENRPGSNSVRDFSARSSGAFRSSQTPLGYRGGCFGGRRRCDEQPLFSGVADLASFLPQADVRAYSPVLCGSGGLGSRHTSNPCIDTVRPSIQDAPAQTEARSFGFLSRIGGRISSFFWRGCRLFQQLSNAGASEPQSGPLIDLRQPLFSSTFQPLLLDGNKIEYIKTIPTRQEVYDFEVEKYHNYIAGGMVHHNTTILTLLGLSVMYGKYPWDDTSLLHLFPHNFPRKVRYVGQGWQDHIKAVVIPELKKWWPAKRKVETRGNGVITDTFWRDEETGSTLEIMSNNQQSKEHEGWSGDLILYDEPCRKQIYIANARGLVDRRGREVFAATLLDEPWIDREIIKKTDENNKPDKRVFWVEGESYDNVGYGISKEGLE